MIWRFQKWNYLVFRHPCPGYLVNVVAVHVVAACYYGNNLAFILNWGAYDVFVFFSHSGNNDGIRLLSSTFSLRMISASILFSHSLAIRRELVERVEKNSSW